MSPRQSSPARLFACLLGGALGDALGAPAEGLRSLEQVRQRFGPAGLWEFHPYTSPWEQVAMTGVGALTDDTTMHATTLAAMVLAADQPGQLHPLSWQGYLQWGSRQEGGEGLAPLVDPDISWPREVAPFWFGCGAGRGTIAALQVGRPGSATDPIDYDTIIRGKRVIGPNDGCGGMMRAPILAFWPESDDAFAVGVENARLTHSAAPAYLGTGVVTALTAAVAQGLPLTQAFAQVCHRLQQEPGHEPVLAAGTLAWETGQSNPDSLDVIDHLPTRIGVSNAFRALPVLAQTIYALSSADKRQLGFKQTLSLAVSHGGDSDSVGAIVGSILGAAHGKDALPDDWMKKLQLREELEKLSALAIRRLYGPKP